MRPRPRPRPRPSRAGCSNWPGWPRPRGQPGRWRRPPGWPPRTAPGVTAAWAAPRVNGARAWTAPRIERSGLAVKDTVAPKICDVLTATARRVDVAAPRPGGRCAAAALAPGGGGGTAMSAAAGAATAIVLRRRKDDGTGGAPGQAADAGAPDRRTRQTASRLRRCLRPRGGRPRGRKPRGRRRQQAVPGDLRAGIGSDLACGRLNRPPGPAHHPHRMTTLQAEQTIMVGSLPGSGHGRKGRYDGQG